MILKAVIFDFDGLLLDTEWAAFSAWNHIFKEHGQELRLEKWVLCVGSGYHLFDPVRELETLTGLSLNGQELLRRKEKLKQEACALLPLMEGAHEAIGTAKKAGFKVGLASSSFRPVIHGHLERLGIASCFDATVTGDEVAQIKPHPDLYDKCARILGVQPENCLVFEDSLNGVKAAKQAGMCCVAVPNRVTRGLDFSLADQVVDSLRLFTWTMLV